MSPWRAYVLTGSAKERLPVAPPAANEAQAAVQEAHASEYRYYLGAFFEPYLGRPRKVSCGLYGLLGIARGDTAKTHAQHRRNYEFFGAPVRLIFTTDRRLEIGSWLYLGMFLQKLKIAAWVHGLDTCPKAAFTLCHDPPSPERVGRDEGGSLRHGPWLRRRSSTQGRHGD